MTKNKQILLEILIAELHKKLSDHQKQMREMVLLSDEPEKILSETDEDFILEQKKLFTISAAVGKMINEIRKLESLHKRIETENETTDGFLFTVKFNNLEHKYFLLSVCGGMEIKSPDGCKVLIIGTNTSMGDILYGKKKGDTVFMFNHQAEITEIV